MCGKAKDIHKTVLTGNRCLKLPPPYDDCTYMESLSP